MIIFDLDGTLANCEHRRHFVDPCKNEDYFKEYDELDRHGVPCNYDKYEWCHKDTGKPWKPDWKSFYEACGKDEPIEPICEIMRMYTFHKRQFEIWSGRCESVRSKTFDWIKEYIFFGNDLVIPKIKMRPIGDSTPDDQLKEIWLDETYDETKWGRKTKVEFVFDDRPKVLRMWRRRGMFVFNCCQHDEEF